MDSPDSLWSAACESLRKKLHRDFSARWIEPIVAKRIEDGVLVLAVDNEWSRFFVEQNFADSIRDALREADPTVRGAKLAEEAGADIIIGGHPHVIEPVEILTAPDGHKVPCF